MVLSSFSCCQYTRFTLTMLGGNSCFDEAEITSASRVRVNDWVYNLNLFAMTHLSAQCPCPRPCIPIFRSKHINN